MTATAQTIDRHYMVDPETTEIRREIDVIGENLDLAGARVLELGCGAAAMTRLVAENLPVRAILATEVDRIQHARNLAAEAIDKVEFASFGAEAIAAADASFDCVMMFKSLHHVPTELMDRALEEIARVLKPGGAAYLSEPVYAGEFNDILRIFHDEAEVRQAAFDAVGRALERGSLVLDRQLFFRTNSHYESFAQFEQRILQATHTDHRLAPDLYVRVKARFQSHLGADGAYFANPMRVDLLRKPA